MLDELLRSSHGLFLDVGPPPAAPDKVSESPKYLDCVGLAGLPWDPDETTDEFMCLLGLG